MATRKKKPVEPTLDDLLTQATTEADAFRGSLEPDEATAADIASLDASRTLVDRFLLDVEEALKQVFVAGLAYPDPELADELASLSDRARRHGLPTATEGLDRLRILLLATHAERDLMRRQELAHRSWDETQRFVAWLRLFRVEYDLLAVQSRLEQDAEKADAEETAPVFPTATLTARPLGMNLSASGRLLLYCQDVETGGAVVFHDHLAEWSRENPLRAPAISRLFQDSLFLGDVLAGVIRTEDHPVAWRRGAAVLRPAFAAIPEVLAVADDFAPVPLPSTGPGPHREALHVSLTQGRPRVSPSTAMSQTLQFNLIKLLTRERRDHLELDAVLVSGGGDRTLLSVTTGFDGRVFPTYDTALFRQARSVVHARAVKVDERLGGTTVAGFWVRAASCLLHGATHAEIDSLRNSLPTRRALGVAEHYRLGYAAFLLDEVHHPEGMRTLLETALRLATASSASDIDPVDLALVLGQRRSSSADFRLLDGNFVYQTLWLVYACALADDLRGPLRELWKARYASALVDPGWGDVVARVLLLLLMHETGQMGGEDAVGAMEDAVGEAAVFLAAHVGDLRQHGGNRTAPELIEWLQLGDTFAWLHDLDRFGVTIRALGVTPERLWIPVSAALLGWTLDVEHGGSTQALAMRAGDALAVAVAVDMSRLLVS